MEIRKSQLKQLYPLLFSLVLNEAILSFLCSDRIVTPTRRMFDTFRAKGLRNSLPAFASYKRKNELGKKRGWSLWEFPSAEVERKS